MPKVQIPFPSSALRRHRASVGHRQTDDGRIGVRQAYSDGTVESNYYTKAGGKARQKRTKPPRAFDTFDTMRSTSRRAVFFAAVHPAFDHEFSDFRAAVIG